MLNFAPPLLGEEEATMILEKPNPQESILRLVDPYNPLITATLQSHILKVNKLEVRYGRECRERLGNAQCIRCRDENGEFLTAVSITLDAYIHSYHRMNLIQRYT